ncbi:hypothetical protein [Halorhodospira sp. 9622]|uniref:hypothetical protein n=1 Tax=Halorhodospira sp. 9622 TaxID=2899136 RepID=UPI001EE8698F|nr:hypothetical protein [Halorhodospira sp. 9622]MCG5539103.1 hypothetical protein [Halorhodospira sp. 9622]
MTADATQTSSEACDLAEALELESISLTSLHMDTPEQPETQSGKLRFRFDIGHDHEALAGGAGGTALASAEITVQGYPEDAPEPSADASQVEDGLLIYLRARYSLVYRVVIPGQWSEAEQEHFNVRCVAYHAWPYFRELVQNVTSRSPIRDVTLPLFVPSKLNRGAD